MNEARVILHADLDAFFASVEQRDFPELKGKPVIVGGASGNRGVVAAASYEARKFGIHSAMPAAEARRRCPDAVFRPVRGEAIHQASRQVFEIFESFTPHIQKLSVDEAFLDITGSLHLWDHDEVRLAEELRAQVKEKVKLTISVGIAGNKFLAKLASDMDKPDGLTVVPREQEEVRRFLAPLDVGRVWGVGKKSRQRLEAKGLRTIRDLQDAGLDRLVAWFGDHSGAHLFALAHGLDDRPVSERDPEKSISNETTFEADLADREDHHRILLQLTEKVGGRLRATGFWAGGVQLKIRSSAFKTYTRQRQLTRPSRRDRDIWEAVWDLYQTFDPPWPVRLLGVGVHDLTENPGPVQQQLDLFTEDPGPASTTLDDTIDRLREKYGRAAVMRARGVRTDQQ
jgi:DNA polymerase-4